MGRTADRLRASFLVAAALGTATAAASPAPLPAPSAPAVAIGPARPLAGWLDLCRRSPAECAVDEAEPSALTLTPPIWRLIRSVNRRVNATVLPLADSEHWGVSDRWDAAADGFGDCEDYQILKRRRLAEAGLPRRTMRIAVVIDDNGDGHAVLTIRTDRGDFVLDNKTDAVLPWHRTGYAFVKREGQSSAEPWVSLGDAAPPTGTAIR